MNKKIAVVLSGCGQFDGSEIREAVGTLWALSEHAVAAQHAPQTIETQCFAPAGDQAAVINHFTGKAAANERRSMLVEAARLARGKIRDLRELDPAQYQAVIFPGGYGAATNLCNFATNGNQGVVCAEAQAVIDGMFAARKPIGAICIAPAMVGLALKGRGLELTVGQPCEASQEIEKMGHRHVVCSADEAHVDTKHRIVTTPAYMYDNAPLHEIFAGIRKLVAEIVRMV